MLVERVGQLLARSLQLLAEGEAVQHDGILAGMEAESGRERRQPQCRQLPALSSAPSHDPALTHSSCRAFRMAGMLVADGGLGRMGWATANERA